MSRTRSREVEIFNFSFLDILACTIGLLIFIMVMVFILQSSGPVANSAVLIEQKLTQASVEQKSAAHDAQITDALEAALDRVQVPGEPDLKPQRDGSRAARDTAQARFDQASRDLISAQSALDSARLAQDRSIAQSLAQAKADLAAAQAAHTRAESELADAHRARSDIPITLSPIRRPDQNINFDFLFVDCRADKVILMKETNGKIVEVGRTAVTDVANPKSDFQRLISTQGRSDNPLVLFWIRPTGYATYSAAIDVFPESVPHGFEPADADWTFQSFESAGYWTFMPTK
jgi:hypothetical protein